MIDQSRDQEVIYFDKTQTTEIGTAQLRLKSSNQFFNGRVNTIISNTNET